MAQSKHEKVIRAVTLLVLLGGGWLYFSGRVDSVIESYQARSLSLDEAIFVQIIQDAKHQWKDAPNDMQRMPMRAARDLALCSLHASVDEWVGTVADVNTYLFAEDLASFSVTLVPNTTLRTEGDLENLGSKIARGTTLFEAVSKLAPGQKVIFSGHFIKSDRPCLVETSLTDRGSMTDPGFLFTFTGVKVAG